MKTMGTKTIGLDKLQENLFVRKQLNQDHVLYLAELIENGVKMKDLIEVAEDFRIVEGRHRKEAYELNGVSEVSVRMLKFENDAEMIAYAYKANTGGSLPPTPEDTEHTILLLLEQGEPKKQIGDLLGLPAGMARRYVAEVQSKAARAKMQRAAAAITDGGLTVAQAAENYGVDADKLKETLSGHRKRNARGITEIQRGLTRSYKSLGSKNAALIRSLLEKYEDGDVTEKQVGDILDHIEQLQKKAVRAVTDWRHRFATMGNGNGNGVVNTTTVS